ncbi:alpha/beta hydrolase [Neptunitalea lumnitzerae]|uniref:Lipase n=1 Tax=Neptunitalea lumnitzerae TaxID=2965509 RepID=A0ABQ5MFK1_9FLAO|nr:alpha/beta hydrolase fold domain-containing protein [Neptunitalea sp. Y10]GLB48101.1 lipase [Neptunitalea sp. Y10]
MKAFKFVLTVCAVFVTTLCVAQTTYTLEKNIAYKSGDDLTAYEKERCKLDIYYPTNVTNAPTIVWFHGGGLTGGEKSIPEELKNQGAIIVAPNYRLSPKVKSTECIEDAVAATAWIMQNIEKYHGDPKKIVMSGHSAGGYLSMMVIMNRIYLAKLGINANQVAALVPFSGHTITHFTTRQERGIPGTQPVIDKYAPLYYVRKDTPPVLLITGDREKEMLGRYEENAYFYRMLKVTGNTDVEIKELKGEDHGSMVAPGCKVLLAYMKEKGLL